MAGVAAPGSSRMASSYSLTGKVSSRRPRRRGLPGAVGALCHGCAMDTAALFGGLVVGLVLGGFIAFLWVRGSSCRGRRPQRPSETCCGCAWRTSSWRAESADAAALSGAALDTIGRVERQVGALERDRVEQFGELGERLTAVSRSTESLRSETATLRPH